MMFGSNLVQVPGRTCGVYPAALALFAGLSLSAPTPARPAHSGRAEAARQHAQVGFEEYETREFGGTKGRVSNGRYRVFEDRDRQSGRTIGLDVVVLHATSKAPLPDPIVYVAGGPGQNAASIANGMLRWWPRSDRDIVFVSQRGTGSDHRLDVELAGTDTDLQTYFDPIFDPDRFRRGAEVLSKRADLRLYSTPIASDDLAEVLTALGYDQVNLYGGSYGTRASLVFMRRHEARVRSAILRGVAPLSFKNPLFHAEAAQLGLEKIFEEVEGNPTYRKVYPDLRGTVDRILTRLDDRPVAVKVKHPGTGEAAEVILGRTAFCEALRVLMYYTGRNRRVPLLLKRAGEGDFTEFAQLGLDSARGIRRSLAFGMLMCVTAAEDLDRISEEEIVESTRGTFLGDGRVREQMAVGLYWPKSDLPVGFGDPVGANTPTLVLSGSHDPVTPPKWGARASEHLPNSIHVVVPSAHDVGVSGLEAVEREFLAHCSPADLDLTPIQGAVIPPLVLDL